MYETVLTLGMSMIFVYLKLYVDSLPLTKFDRQGAERSLMILKHSYLYLFTVESRWETTKLCPKTDLRNL